MNAARGLWTLDPAVTFLNHGSFGACPRPVLARQQALRDQLERQPVRFFVRDAWPLMEAARTALAGFLGARPLDLAFVTNATAGVSTVLRSLRLRPGDELLTTDHAYRACRHALDFVAELSGARVVVAAVPFPLAREEEVTASVLAAAGPRTRLALLDHVTSPTGLVLPIARLVAELQAGGVDVLVDGAHAPGLVPLDLDALGAAYYTGNCHKWLCAPKGAGFLHVRPDRQEGVRPLVVSHGHGGTTLGPTRFQSELAWSGTCDPTPWMCLPAALDTMGSLLPGGWPALMTSNRALALAARERLCQALGIPAPAPAGMLAALATVPLPPALAAGVPPLDPATASPFEDPLHAWLLDRRAIEVPIFPWPSGPLVRVSAQAYNEPADYERLAAALLDLVGAGPMA